MIHQTLPPMPPSDPASLANNSWDSNYQTRSGNFWQGSVTHIEDKPMLKCNHFFNKTKTGVRCDKCHYGLVGNMTVLNGKLVKEGRQIEL